MQCGRKLNVRLLKSELPSNGPSPGTWFRTRSIIGPASGGTIAASSRRRRATSRKPTRNASAVIATRISDWRSWA